MDDRQYAGPMAERGGQAISARDARLSKTDRPPTTLEELSHRLSDSIESAHGQAGRIRDFADSILGTEPEPTKAGNSHPEPPPMGRGNQLLDQARALSQALTSLREQVDRLARI